MNFTTPKTITSIFGYDPFGMALVGRNWSLGNEYRYGFNGKESDSETYGEGNIYDYGFRIYNPRLGRFLSVDPLFNSFAWVTPYQFAFNRPIVAIDLDGLEADDICEGVTGDGVGSDANETNCDYDTYTPTQLASGDIEPVDVAEYNGTMPYGNSRASESFVCGDYEILPNYSYDADGCETLSFYTASIMITDLSGSRGTFDIPRIDWVIPADQIDNFIINVNKYASIANWLYGTGYHMRESTIIAWNGDIWGAYKTLFIDEWTRPLNWLYIATGVAGTAKFGVQSRGFGVVAKTEANTGIKFSTTPSKHMSNPDRYVPLTLQEEIINTAEAFPDPKGSAGKMYYGNIYRDGAKYNLEILYDKASNTIWHFEYGRRTMGPLPEIPK